MSASITLLVLSAVLCGTGVYVMLERSLTRILVGFLLLGNGINLLLFLMAGRSGQAPLIGDVGEADSIVDPVPQVLMLTAIVINFGITAFLLALIYRSWWLANLGDEGDTVSDEHEEDERELEDAERMSVSIEEDDEAMRAELASEVEDTAHAVLDAADSATGATAAVGEGSAVSGSAPSGSSPSGSSRDSSRDERDVTS
ncbi:Na(+)/H(+) antiporter subunit C [Humibacter sp. BT305]|nr:Na(+)/H(+) antiporter subunit C [Humibacter sp. BT305]